MVHNPLLVLADEPTGNMDEETGSTVLRLLDTLVRQMRKTLIIVTHSPEVTQLTDRIFSLEAGWLAEKDREVI